jgi:hypothetical protein
MHCRVLTQNKIPDASANRHRVLERDSLRFANHPAARNPPSADRRSEAIWYPPRMSVTNAKGATSRIAFEGTRCWTASWLATARAWGWWDKLILHEPPDKVKKLIID